MNDNKTLISEYLEALSGKPKTREAIERYVADEGLIQHILEAETTFPGYQLTAEEMLAADDKVVVRGMMRGKHLGPFAGIPPTGKTVEASVIIIYQVGNQKVVNHWMQFDGIALMQQLQQGTVTAV